jgi:hypothetical protein
MGVFSLAGHRVEIRSRARDSAGGWRVIIPADAWETSAACPVEPFEIAVGTEILIDLPSAWEAELEKAAASAALFYPLPVNLNGSALPHDDFLRGAHQIETWEGYRIAVYLERGRRDRCAPRINFHGVTLLANFPSVAETGEGGCWDVSVDIVDAPQLQLVLPARKEMVENDAVVRLRTACARAIYRAIAARPDHRLSYTNWCEARDLGIVLPEAVRQLERWTPMTADRNAFQSGEPVEGGPMIVVPWFEADIEQGAEPMLRQLDLLDAAPVREFPPFEGYAWYDALPSVTQIQFAIDTGESIHLYQPDLLPEHLCSGHVPAISLNLSIASSRLPDALTEIRSFPIDLLVCNNETYWLDASPIFVREGAAVSVDELTECIVDSLFQPDDAAGADSWSTQRDRFIRDAREQANSLLLGEDEAVLANLWQVLSDDFAWRVPRGKALTAIIADRTVIVSLAPGAGA